MKLVAYPLAAALTFFGIMFVAGSNGSVMRIVVGVDINRGCRGVFMAGVDETQTR